MTDAHFQGKPKCCILSNLSGIVFQSWSNLIDESQPPAVETNQIIQEHQSSSKWKTVALDATLKVSNMFCSLSFLRYFTTFQGFFFTPFQFFFLRRFVPVVFFEKTHPRALDDLHHRWRKNMSTQSFIKGCVYDLTKRFPHHGIYTIQSTINCILSLWTLLVATKPLWPLSVTLFIQIQL